MQGEASDSMGQTSSIQLQFLALEMQKEKCCLAQGHGILGPGQGEERPWGRLGRAGEPCMCHQVPDGIYDSGFFSLYFK